MEINGKTKIYGIIGNPIEHTLSPLMHGMFADAAGLDMVYVPFHVADGQLEAALRGAYGLNICGMNVTVPYKNAVIPYLTEVDQRAAAAGAVNTLVRDAREDREGFIGYNTDMNGLWRAMKEEGISLEGKEVIILGAGGAGRAAAFLCANSGVKKVVWKGLCVRDGTRCVPETSDRGSAPVYCDTVHQRRSCAKGRGGGS